ncbi:ArgP/LysG family DNA-binding transcriptional regulator [uncultured Nocardioides sp.]|uniref:ArgP/LysG family DNA-binding transcriptional regulator n=1 Tax=uncultured Nocardioides sp. TaxID=198441 RepID=UPI0025FAF2BC|nr:ArgP/LysG family DNA-binding transcriptional regulator [uncultured Nocardioides sp.]
MRPNPQHLEALVAVVEQGTFESAAASLHLTPSAVSQRIRALESEVGQVLVRRATPCTATEVAEPLLRLARQTRLLQDEATAALGSLTGTTLAVAVNADSLATWFRDVLGAVAGMEGVALRLHVEDQGWSADLLRRGETLAAVTSDPSPVQGCSVTRLGTLRYVPAATPALVHRHRRGGRTDWAALPMVDFNEKDSLQLAALQRRGRAHPRVVHRVPTSADFLEAVRRGLGWGMLPEPQLAEVAGDVEVLPALGRVDVPLYWQRWRLASERLDALTAAVASAAAAGLRP